MNKRQYRICLVTSSHVASNPRLVKEANAFIAAGYDVRVVAVDVSPAVRLLDKTVFSSSFWRYTLVDRGNQISWTLRGFMRKVARSLYKYPLLRSSKLAEMALSHLIGRLTEAALLESADLYIAHTLPALPAAAKAASHYAAKLGFDAEDFHSGELDPDLFPLEGRLCEVIETKYLHRCDYLTASSPLIAEAYRQRYGVEMITLLNVFSLSEAPLEPRPEERVKPVLYWFSQTLGPDRGLEAMIHVMAAMRTPVEMRLCGTPLPDYQEKLSALANTLGLEKRIHFFPPAPPFDMVRLASKCMIGLSLENDYPQNRAICLTNKIFTYLLAGIPVLLSRTPAHIELANSLGEAALLVDLTRVDDTARQLDTLMADKERLRIARETAWRLGHEKYNWDFEQQALLAQINTLLKEAGEACRAS